MPTSAIRQRVGSRIRELRATRGWSQEELGERAGVSYKFIGEVERAIGNPTVDTLAALAAALDVDVAELIGPPSTRPADAWSTHDVVTAREALQSVAGLLDRMAPWPRRRKAKAKRTPRR